MLKSALNHPKMLHLAKLLGEEITTARGIMESLWLMAADLAPRGDIGKFTDEEIVAALHWQGLHSSLTPTQIIEAIVKARFLDHDETHRYLIHDWPSHCDEYVHRKLAIATKYFCNGAVPSLKRFKEAQRPEILKRYAMLDGKPAAVISTTEEFERFWELYPRKRHKDRAEKWWAKNVQDTTLARAIVHGLEAQLAVGMFSDKTNFNPYPKSWLEAGAWEDALEAQTEEPEPTSGIEERNPDDNPNDIATALGLDRDA